MSISKKAWVGLATETTPGTAIVAPTLYLPVKHGGSIFENIRDNLYSNEDRNSRDTNNNRVAGVRQGKGSLAGNWYNDACGYPLLAFMGQDTPSQPNVGTAPTVWLHTLALADTPPSLTLTKSYDAKTYQFAYCAVEMVKIMWSAKNKTLEFEAGVQSKWGTKLGAPPTPAYSTLNPFQGWLPVITMNGGSSNDVSDFTITLTQKIVLWYSSGNQDVQTIYYGDRDAKLDFTARFDADTYYDAKFFTTQTDDAISLAVTGPLIAATYNQSLTMNFPIVGIDAANHDTSGENVVVKYKGTARPSNVANSLFTATMQNTVTSYTV